MIGGGERKLIERLVGAPHQDRVEECLELYLDHYTRHNGELTRLYPGVAETLALLSGKKLAVLSNKLQRLTRQTLEAIDIARFFAAIRGGGAGAGREGAGCWADSARTAQNGMIRAGRVEADFIDERPRLEDGKGLAASARTHVRARC